MLQNLDFIQSFVEEARVHVETVESELLKMDIACADPESINNVFRAVHSIKGTAGFFNLSVIVGLSHAMENLFGEVRAGRLQLDSGMVDTLLAANDSLKYMVENVTESENTDVSGLEAKLKSAVSGDAAGAAGAAEGTRAPGGTERAGGRADREVSRKDRLEADLRGGSFLYELTLKQEADLRELGGAVRFAANIREIGNIVDVSADIDTEDVTYTMLVTTVLEKDLLAEALGISQDRIAAAQEGSEAKLEAGAPPAKSADSDEKPAPKAASAASDGSNGAAREGGTERAQGIAVEDSVRVHVTLLNNLLNLASEMVLGRNQLLRAMERHRKGIAGIEPILQNIDHITTELQERIMQTRMQPISNVFNKFPRIIRELSRKLQKEVELKLEGSDVELDKSIIEALGDPLTHLVRNSADHGLEQPSERERNGKPRTGSIVMKAYHEGGYVNIDVTDDGKGIDMESIRKKAIEKGLINKSDAQLMGEQEILQLLFKPGFSTAEAVTDVSGRGVGMDVVKTNIEKLGGTIEIFTVLGKGTTVRLMLPLTLAIISSLIVQVEDQKFALPQVNLQEIVRIKPGDRSKRIEYVNSAEVLRLRGKLLPIVHLADVVGIKRSYIDPVTGERKPERRKTLFDSRLYRNDEPLEASSDELRTAIGQNILRILVVKVGSRRLGIAVNAIHESEEILVKPLPVHIKDCKCYSGVTILGDGRTVMILDPGGIMEKANLRFSEGQDDARPSELQEEETRIREQQDLLLFKCSGPEMLAVDLSMVSRVEETEPGSIETIGNREYIKFRGEILRVVRPEDFLPISKSTDPGGKQYVIIPKLVKQKIGILIEKIHDTVQTEINLKPGGIKDKGLIGSAIINDRIVLLVNLYELFEKAEPENFALHSRVKPGEKVTILLAEDTPFFQKLEKDYLEGAGYQVLAAQNGKEALRLLQENKVDIVVSDIIMPVMDGLELARRIRENPGYRELPLIALTSLTAESQVKKGMDAGFDAYEFKLDRARLLDIVEQKLKMGGKAG